MKTVALSRNMFAIISDEDFDRVNQVPWYAHRSAPGRYYARRDIYVSYKDGKETKKRLYLHRFLLGVDDKNILIDHINGDTLDNRRENLRVATGRQNSTNQTSLRSDNTSGFRGVYKSKNPKYKNPWIAGFSLDGKRKHIGSFATAEEAARAFDAMARLTYGEYCGKLNFE